MFDLMTHSTHLLLHGVRHGIWPSQSISLSEKSCINSWTILCDLLYAPSHRQDSTYHGICQTSYEILVEMRNSPRGIDLMTHHTMGKCSATGLSI